MVTRTCTCAAAQDLFWQLHTIRKITSSFIQQYAERAKSEEAPAVYPGCCIAMERIRLPLCLCHRDFYNMIDVSFNTIISSLTQNPEPCPQNPFRTPISTHSCRAPDKAGLMFLFPSSAGIHTWWSPRSVSLPRRGTPRLPMTSVVPGCVPAGIRRSTGPSTVVTCHALLRCQHIC